MVDFQIMVESRASSLPLSLYHLCPTLEAIRAAEIKRWEGWDELVLGSSHRPHEPVRTPRWAFRGRLGGGSLCVAKVGLRKPYFSSLDD